MRIPRQLLAHLLDEIRDDLQLTGWVGHAGAQVAEYAPGGKYLSPVTFGPWIAAKVNDQVKRHLKCGVNAVEVGKRMELF